MAKIVKLDLACAIAACLEFGDARGIDVEADHPGALSAEGDSDGQPHISKTDDGKLATVRHDLTFGGVPIHLGFLNPRTAPFATDTQAVFSSKR